MLTNLCHLNYNNEISRGLFIIDNKGTLRQITVNDLPVGRSVDETLRLVQAFQFVDKHGEVCPAGWKPGSDTVSFFNNVDVNIFTSCYNINMVYIKRQMFEKCKRFFFLNLCRCSIYFFFLCFRLNQESKNPKNIFRNTK